MYNFEAVLFDMDGVLLNSPPFHWVAWSKILKDLGAEVTERQCFLLEGRPAKEILSELLIQNGLPEPIDGLDYWVAQKREFYHRIAKLSWYPQALARIKALKSSGIKVGLVTGAGRCTLEKIVEKEVLTLFDTIVTADAVENGKPAPDPYINASKGLNVSPHHCIAVENAPLGIQSAKSAGMQCIAITTTLNKNDLVQADCIISDIGFLDSALQLFLRDVE